MRTTAPTMVNEPFKESTNNAPRAAIRRRDFGAKSFLSITIGIKIMLIARIIAVLHTTEPIPLPIAMPTLSCDAVI